MHIFFRFFRTKKIGIKDSNKRSIVKALSWRLFATLTTMIIVFVATGELTLSVGVGLVEVTIKLVLYYLHERIWNQTQWGQNKTQLPSAD